MKIVKTTFSIIIGLAVAVFGYLYIIDHGFARYNLPGSGLLSKIESPLKKDLTFGIKLYCLPTVKVKSGFKTYIVYDESAYESADQKIYTWFQESMEDRGGEGLAKMRSEIKIMEAVYEKIISAERLTTDGTPEQKLLNMEKQLIAKLHDTLAQGSNLNLQYGHK